jgi:hypothetical protein
MTCCCCRRAVATHVATETGKRPVCFPCGSHCLELAPDLQIHASLQRYDEGLRPETSPDKA